MIAGKTIEEWKRERPMIRQMIDYKELFWENNRHLPFERAKQAITITEKDIDEAEAVLKRFAPYISKVFPETSQNKGLIESPLKRIERMKKILEKESGSEIPGKLLLKCDSHLPISGSIKARGGDF